MQAGERDHRQSLGMLLAGIAAVLAVVAIVHGPVLSAEAVTFDDEQFLLRNHLVRNPSLASVGRFFGEILEPSTVGGYYLPLAMTSLMFDSALGGSPENLAPFHRTSLGLHLINTALVILFFAALWGRPIPALVAGLLFGLHPLTVEPVAWIGERKTLLATCFALIALLSYVRSRSRRAYAVSLIAYVLALLSKPTAIMLPILFVVLDYWPLRRLSHRTLIEKLPFFLVAGISAAITLISHGRTAEVQLVHSAGVAHIPLLIAHLVHFYIMKFLWPARLSMVYPLPEPLALGTPRVLFGLLFTTLIVAITLISLRRTRAVAAAFLFFFVAILPALGLIQYSWVTAADKYMYLPMLGLLLLVTAGVRALWDARKRAVHVLVILAVVAIAGAQAHGVRGYLAHWHTTIGLHEYMLTLTPDSDEVLNNLGVGFMAEGRTDAAIDHFRRALARQPSNPKALNNLGSLLAERGELGEALTLLRRAVRIAPDYAEAQFNLGNTLRAGGERSAAADAFRRTIALEPDHADAHLNLGNLLFDQGDYTAALEHYDRVVAIDPGFAAAYGNRGNALRALGRFDDAIASYRRAIALDPGLPNAQSALGLTLMGSGRLTEALTPLRRALELRPGWLEPRNAITWILATHPDPAVRDAKRAIGMAEEAAAQTEHGDPGILDTLGAAYAADGRYEEAVAIATRAIMLAREAGATGMATSIAARLELYRQEQPFRCRAR